MNPPMMPKDIVLTNGRKYQLVRFDEQKKVWVGIEMLTLCECEVPAGAIFVCHGGDLVEGVSE